MVSKAPFARFAIDVGARAVGLGIASAICVSLLFYTKLFATAGLAGAVVGLIAFDLARLIRETDSRLALMVRSITPETSNPPATSTALSFRKTIEALSAARVMLATDLDVARTENAKLAAALDTTSAALFFLDRGHLRAINRSAHKLERVLPGAESGRPHVPVTDAAGGVNASSISGRSIVRLADGQAALVTRSILRTPSATALEIISLLPLQGELDAVELKARADFAKVLAHEILNSLAPITAIAESVGDRLAATTCETSLQGYQEISAALAIIRRRSLGLQRFVERYRSVADMPVADRQAVAITGLVADITALMRARLPTTTIRYAALETDIAAFVDHDLIAQALINLILNAAEAGASLVEVQVTVDAEPSRDHLVLRVTDNGPGVKSEDVDAIFVPFFTTKVDGAGVGLNFVRQVAVAHHGSVLLNQDAGRTSFHLILPLQR